MRIRFIRTPVTVTNSYLGPHGVRIKRDRLTLKLVKRQWTRFPTREQPWLTAFQTTGAWNLNGRRLVGSYKQHSNFNWNSIFLERKASQSWLSAEKLGVNNNVPTNCRHVFLPHISLVCDLLKLKMELSVSSETLCWLHLWEGELMGKNWQQIFSDAVKRAAFFIKKPKPFVYRKDRSRQQKQSFIFES